MNWEAIGAVGEILGACGVIATLFYLAIQVRVQNKEARLAAMHDISTAFRESYTAFNDGGIADIFIRGNKDFTSLSDTEKIRLFATVNPLIKVFEEAFNQYNQGRLDEQLWHAMTKQYSFLLSAPSLEQVWKQRRTHYNETFREFVDGLEKTKYEIR
jgi:hypothetical protein